MKQIKTFARVVTNLNDNGINEFLSKHNVLSINSYVSQGFTFADSYISDLTIKPSLITTIIYDDDLKRSGLND